MKVWFTHDTDRCLDCRYMEWDAKGSYWCTKKHGYIDKAYVNEIPEDCPMLKDVPDSIFYNGLFYGMILGFALTFIITMIVERLK